jgi:hypothetical protein
MPTEKMIDLGLLLLLFFLSPLLYSILSFIK